MTSMERSMTEWARMEWIVRAMDSPGAQTIVEVKYSTAHH